MTNPNLKAFYLGNFPVRVFETGGEFWFVEEDICNVLVLDYPLTSSIKEFVEDERRSLRISEETIDIISETGVQSLIFYPSREKFKRFGEWVMREVLQSSANTEGGHDDQ